MIQDSPQIDAPPSALTVQPLMKSATRQAMKSTIDAISCSDDQRFAGVARRCISSSSRGYCLVPDESTRPGARATAVIPY